MKESSENNQPIKSLRKFQENKTTFILCDCRSEVLVLEYDYECKFVELSIYENLSSYGHKMSFWQKIRYCWQVIWKNKPFSDQIILNTSQVKQLREFLASIN